MRPSAVRAARFGIGFLIGMTQQSVRLAAAALDKLSSFAAGKRRRSLRGKMERMFSGLDGGRTRDRTLDLSRLKVRPHD
ncbi:hypothetical protein, partial [Propionicimonas sp.]|uniref:hypothetical protein n=1 Tax=Propionicimonas sp. TaxID=1955623 RepID=UPI0039E33362